MTNEELLFKALMEYGKKRYPKIEVSRTVSDGTQGIGMREFIESLSYGNQKQGRIVPA
jgi:hypothetical protein